MRQFIHLALTILGILSICLPGYAAETESKVLKSVVIRKEYSMIMKPLHGDNCTLKDDGLAYDTENDKAWNFSCTVDAADDARSFLKAGYEYGDLRTRDAGGNFLVEGISTKALGFAIDLKTMPVQIMAKMSVFPTRNYARDAIFKMMDEEKLRLHMSFARHLCSIDGVDVSQDRKLCNRD